jgi:hypothetical protein
MPVCSVYLLLAKQVAYLYLTAPDERSSLSASYSSALAAFWSFYETALPVETPTIEPKGCTPFTGVQTRNGACTWTGVFSEVPITCDADAIGEGYTLPSGNPTIFSQSELRAWTSLRYAVATIVEATPALTPTPTPTPTPANTEDMSGAGESAKETSVSEGRASGASMPTGAMLMVGGAAAIGGAAWGF